MKVTQIATHILGYDYDRPWGSARVWFERQRAVIVEVLTDEGIVGWGASSAPPEVCRVSMDSVLAPLVVGQDPFNSERIWSDAYHRVKTHGTRGVLLECLSAVDTALWDIKGKALGVPVHRLLGGRVRDRVPAYATGFYFTQDEDQTRVAIEEGRRFYEQGFRAMKVKLGLGVARDVERFRAVRQEVGDDVTLMTDASRGYGVSDALRLGRHLQDLGAYWFEEPITGEDLDGYVELARALDLRIAGGEEESTKYAFRDIVTRRAMDVIQPDLARCGGITEARKIAALAEAWSIQCIPHVGFTPISAAASLQLLALTPDLPTSRFAEPPYLEIINVQNPLRDELLTEPIRLVNGWVDIPSGPGLGVEVDRAALRRFTIG
ncbi:MAG: mandelate racemase/muconate lactonizing enzyme family protein [Chloroflexi bacterium]|nr:mandelate racemase/muconate lactonizing enzyme family protein [Chloroflexota bacterium]